MPNATVRANAQTMPIDRRAALSALAGGALFAAPRLTGAAEDYPSAELAALIAAHREAKEAFEVAIDELEAAEPDGDTLLQAIGECTWTLRNGRERIAHWIEDHFERLALSTKVIAAVSPTVGAEALAILERERDAALGRLGAAYAAEDAAKSRWDEKNEAEESALLAICAYRCTMPGETATKFRYLAGFRDYLSDEQKDAMFASLAPEGEA